MSRQVIQIVLVIFGSAIAFALIANPKALTGLLDSVGTLVGATRGDKQTTRKR